MTNGLTVKQLHDLKVLVEFVRIYCSEKHASDTRQKIQITGELATCFRKPVRLCPECFELVQHGMLKRLSCPLEPKPSCRKCSIHCYSREHRAKIRGIMAFSGKRQILRGRIDYLWHYYF